MTLTNGNPWHEARVNAFLVMQVLMNDKLFELLIRYSLFMSR